MSVALTLLALLTDIAFGYPKGLLDRIGHPVVWMGWLISMLDRKLNLETGSAQQRRLAGVAALVVLVAASAILGFILEGVLLVLPFGFALAGLARGSLIAQRSLDEHVAAVAGALESEGVEAGREAVSRIVGRDTADLDEAAISRAAIESLAESFSDGVVAPALWLALGGLGAGAAYKAVNTADSMIGRRTPRHEAFGWASARFDDLLNLPASRLTALLIVLASVFVPGASSSRAAKAAWRDGDRHRSPNAGWPEAAMGGALGLALAGPRLYAGTAVEDAIMGRGGRREATARDIRAALRLYRVADGILIGAFATVLWFILRD